MKKNEQSDIDFEIDFYKGILVKNPKHTDAMIILGDLYTKKGLYAEGLEIDLKLESLRPDDPIVLYNLACSYSLLEKTDLAFQAIKKAINYGYDEIDYLANDPDFANLFKNQDFMNYFNDLKKKKDA